MAPCATPVKLTFNFSLEASFQDLRQGVAGPSSNFGRVLLASITNREAREVKGPIYGLLSTQSKKLHRSSSGGIGKKMSISEIVTKETLNRTEQLN